MRALIFSLCAFSFASQATELVYTPVNPSFGGNSLNANFLLSKAQSQNNHTDDSNTLGFEDQFKAALERNIINTLTRRISDGELTEGTYNTGDYQIDVSGAEDAGVNVTITNLATGEVTVISMPSVG